MNHRKRSHEGDCKSNTCYNGVVSDRAELLNRVMADTGTTQRELARLSGVHQPSISQFLSARTNFSDDQLARLLACMGYRLEVTRRAVTPELTRSERQAWLLHRPISIQLTRSTLFLWDPLIRANLERLRAGVGGQPHLRNLDRWRVLVDRADVAGLRRVLTGLDRDAIEMREVTPMSGVLSEKDRLAALEQM